MFATLQSGSDVIFGCGDLLMQLEVIYLNIIYLAIFNIFIINPFIQDHITTVLYALFIQIKYIFTYLMEMLY